jgi:hypothetical protein
MKINLQKKTNFLKIRNLSRIERRNWKKRNFPLSFELIKSPDLVKLLIELNEHRFIRKKYLTNHWYFYYEIKRRWTIDLITSQINSSLFSATNFQKWKDLIAETFQYWLNKFRSPPSSTIEFFDDQTILSTFQMKKMHTELSFIISNWLFEILAEVFISKIIFSHFGFHNFVVISLIFRCKVETKWNDHRWREWL